MNGTDDKGIVICPVSVYNKDRIYTEGTYMYHTILFDLDGTLTDSGPGITNSVAYALKKWGIIENDVNKLKKFVMRLFAIGWQPILRAACRMPCIARTPILG